MRTISFQILIIIINRLQICKLFVCLFIPAIYVLWHSYITFTPRSAMFIPWLFSTTSLGSTITKKQIQKDAILHRLCGPLAFIAMQKVRWQRHHKIVWLWFTSLPLILQVITKKPLPNQFPHFGATSPIFPFSDAISQHSFSPFFLFLQNHLFSLTLFRSIVVGELSMGPFPFILSFLPHFLFT